jgi:hypothetical protein
LFMAHFGKLTVNSFQALNKAKTPSKHPRSGYLKGEKINIWKEGRKV